MACGYCTLLISAFWTRLDKFGQDWTGLERIEKGKMKTSSSQKPSTRAHQRSDNLGISLIEGFLSYLWRMLKTHWRPVTTYVVLYTSLPSEKCISMCIHRKQKFALTTTTKFLFATSCPNEYEVKTRPFISIPSTRQTFMVAYSGCKQISK